MPNRILVLYGSYRSGRAGIRLATYLVRGLTARGEDVELIDAKAVGLPMLDRMYKEYPKGEAPPAMEALLEEWFWRPAAIASYSAGRLAGARASTAWHGTLSEMGMVVISSTLAVGPIGEALDAEGQPTGGAGAALERAFPRFADDLAWWTQACREQRARKAPPY